MPLQNNDRHIEDEIRIVLHAEYGVMADYIVSTIGGWSALAYRVGSAQGEYFLKVYDKSRSWTSSQLEKLNLGMDVASWLENHTGLCGRVNAPLRTKSGKVRVETKQYAYLLFTYIDGTTPANTPLSIDQQQELARIVGELHREGTRMPFDFRGIQETFHIPCADLLEISPIPHDSLCVHQKHDMLMLAIDQAFALAEHVQAERLPLVLCHADIHGWNLMQSDKLVLIDWESIRFAPVEADLFSLWGSWHWGDSHWRSYWDTVVPIYQQYNPQYIFREKVLHFYQLRRHIEDVNDFYRQYVHDDMRDEERQEVVACLERECYHLDLLVRK